MQQSVSSVIRGSHEFLLLSDDMCMTLLLPHNSEQRSYSWTELEAGVYRGSGPPAGLHSVSSSSLRLVRSAVAQSIQRAHRLKLDSL